MFHKLLRYNLSCLLLLVSTALCTAQRVTFNKGEIDRKGYFEELPYELVDGIMFLTPEIDGVKRRFLFDSGAPTQITPGLSKELKPEIINHTEISDATGKKISLNIVLLRQLKLGSLNFNGFPALVAESDMYKCWHIDGVIGSNLFRNAIIQIVPSRHVILLTDDETKLKLSKETRVPLTTGEPQSYPFFVILLKNNKTFKVGFDSGTNNFLRVAEKDMKGLIKGGSFENIATGYGTNNRSLLGLQVADSLYRLKTISFSIAGTAFNNVTTETSKSNNSRIGTKLLDYGSITIDFIHHFFYFDPIRNASMDLTEKLWPMKPVYDDKKLVVGVVWGALIGQLKTGDQIVSINDQSCETMDLCGWLDGQSEKMMGTQTATIEIRDEKGNIKKIRIAKE